MCGIRESKLVKKVKNRFKWPQKFLCCVSLKTGLNVWLAIETLLWLGLFLFVLFHQVIYFSAIDLQDFRKVCNKSYCKLVFGDSAEVFSHKTRCELFEKKYFLSNFRIF